MRSTPPNLTAPLVSLLVPAYNREDYLAACIDSALAQTEPDLEVVVVDGASTDGTWAICETYAARDPRVRIYRDPENTGPVRGWWRCLEEARGQFGTFLWSDDLIMPTFVERTVSVMADLDVGFAFTAAEIGQVPGSGIVRYRRGGGRIRSNEILSDWIEGYIDLPVSPACGMFRLDDLRASFRMDLPTVPPFDLTDTGAGTDLLLFVLTAERYPAIVAFDEPLAFFRAHPGSLTVHGRSGRVDRSYAVTRSWAAKQRGMGPMSRDILARQWLREMRLSRRLQNPMTASARRGHVQSPLTLSMTAAAMLLRSTGRRAWETLLGLRGPGA